MFWHIRKLHKGENRADCSSRSWRESLQFKSTNPLQETEKCSWPEINLTVPFSHKNPAACNNLDFGTQKKKISFIPCRDVDPCWSSLWGLFVFTLGLLCILCPRAGGRMVSAEDKSRPRVSAGCWSGGSQVASRTAPWQAQVPYFGMVFATNLPIFVSGSSIIAAGARFIFFLLIQTSSYILCGI